VFVRPFPDADAGKWQVSNGGGVAPLWRRDGRELFYLSAERVMMGVQVTAGTTPHFGEPQVLFRVRPELLGVESSYYTPWDVAAGAVIMARLLSPPRGDEAPITVVENWSEELRAKTRR
jgi:hypothetical protein